MRIPLKKKVFDIEDAKNVVEKSYVQASKFMFFDKEFNDGVLVSTVLKDESRSIGTSYEEEFFVVNGFNEEDISILKNHFEKIKERENDQE